jgi:hypothetical protein
LLYSILNFLMQLSMLYLMIAMFIILDLLLLSTRLRRLRIEGDKQRTTAAEFLAKQRAEQRRQRIAFEARQAGLVPAE